MKIQIEDLPISRLKAANDKMANYLIKDLKELAVYYSEKQYLSHNEKEAVTIIRTMVDYIETSRCIVDRQHNKINFLITDHQQERKQSDETIQIMQRKYSELLKNTGK